MAVGTSAAVGVAGASAPQRQANHHLAATGTVVDEVSGTFGPMLVIGSGSAKGLAVYAITSDYGTHFGCTAAVVSVLGKPTQCTGPSNDVNAEWPALLTAGAPVAGPGVNAKALGEVNRAGIGEQVTYNGHPLYQFDSIPGIPTGEGWDEATLPPWHGLWYLVSPAGYFEAPAETLTATRTTKGTPALAAVMTAGGGQVAFPLYTLSGASSCGGSCIETWPPLLTTGVPGLLNGIPAKSVGSVKLANGTSQVTFNGKPLYLYGNEAIGFVNGFPLAEGNGNGVAAPAPVKGTFELAAP
jgi:predicted lipoprotein with Yx(FWY)xxD motif